MSHASAELTWTRAGKGKIKETSVYVGKRGYKNGAKLGKARGPVAKKKVNSGIKIMF
jgi:hypothetical protein